MWNFKRTKQVAKGFAMPRFDQIAALAATAPLRALGDVLGMAALVAFIVAGFSVG